MYRNSASVDSKMDPKFLGFNMHCFQQDMYLESNNPISPSLSPTSTGTPTSPLSPLMTPFNPYIMHDQQLLQQQQQQQLNINTMNLAACGGAFGINNPNNNILFNNYMQLQQQLQQQQRQLQQQQQQLLTLKHQQQQQTGNSAAHEENNPNSEQQKNEISKSLQMFALLNAGSPENETTNISQQLDAIMQDFASNGYNCDEQVDNQVNIQNIDNNVNNGAFYKYTSNTLNQLQQGQLEQQFQQEQLLHQQQQHLKQQQQQLQQQHRQQEHFYQQQQQQLQHALNLNLNDIQNNLWMMFPNNIQQQQQTFQQQLQSSNITLINNGCAGNNVSKKSSKRFNNAKNEKYPTNKHCVFCENNNEPEAVVKSHAVRDTFGRVLCPKLRTYICPICKASGDKAHTVKYCPQKPIITMEDAIKAESFRLSKAPYYKPPMKV